MHSDAPPLWGAVEREVAARFTDAATGELTLPDNNVPPIAVRCLSRMEAPAPGSLEPLSADAFRLAYLVAWARAEKANDGADCAPSHLAPSAYPPLA